MSKQEKDLIRRIGGMAGGLALGAGLFAGYAAYRRLLDPPPPEFPYTSPFGPAESYRWLFGDISYNHAGSGQPLLLIHGLNAAACSYEMRKIYEPLSRSFHVYAPDLLGFGLSDRPNLMYTAELYVQLIDDFVREVIQGRHEQHEPVYVIASSLCSAYVIKNAAEHPERYGKLVLICPTGRSTVSDRDSTLGRAIYSFFSLPDLGRAAYNALATRASLTYFLKEKTYYDKELVDDEMIDTYYAASHMPSARYAPASFLSGYFNLHIDQEFASLRQPVLLAWGKQATFTPVEEANSYLALNPAAQLAVYDDCGVLPHDEKVAEFLPQVESYFAAGAESKVES